MPLHLEIVTPERLAFSEDVDAVVCPGIGGERGILAHHAPLLTPLGVGELYQQFELLKAKLEADGLFAPEHKRRLPTWPKRIGIATSAQST